MYLLSTQICWDIAAGADADSSESVSRSVEWYLSVTDRKSIGISVVTYGQVLTLFEVLDCSGERALMRRNFNSLLAKIAAPLPVDVKTTTTWSELEPIYLGTIDRKFNDERMVAMTSERRFIAAAAIRHNKMLIENAQPYHAILQKKFGLRTLDPSKLDTSV